MAAFCSDRTGLTLRRIAPYSRISFSPRLRSAGSRTPQPSSMMTVDRSMFGEQNAFQASRAASRAIWFVPDPKIHVSAALELFQLAKPELPTEGRCLSAPV